MNTFLATATYTGERFMDNGLRFMEMALPKVGKSGADVPLFVVPNKAAGENFDVFQPGVRLLVSGRLYPSRQDYKMYVVPNQPFQLVNDKNLAINRVNISGSVGFIQDKTIDDLFAFTVMCSAPAQMVLNHNWNDSLSFKMESWGDDAKRLDKMLHVGRQVSVEGILRYNCWQAQDGSQRGTYQVRVRAGLYAAFGKNKKLVERPDGTPISSGNQVDLSAAVGEAPKIQMQQDLPRTIDTTSSAVNTEEIPF